MDQKLLNSDQVRSLILRLSDYSENEYNNMIIAGADDYLRRNLRPEDEHAVQAMRKSRFFWKWWINQWDRRNRILLHDIGYDESTRICREERYIFRQLLNSTHSAENLNVYPNRIVMDDTYAIMIGEVHDELHRKKGGAK